MVKVYTVSVRKEANDDVCVCKNKVCARCKKYIYTPGTRPRLAIVHASPIYEYIVNFWHDQQRQRGKIVASEQIVKKFLPPPGLIF